MDVGLPGELPICLASWQCLLGQPGFLLLGSATERNTIEMQVQSGIRRADATPGAPAPRTHSTFPGCQHPHRLRAPPPASQRSAPCGCSTFPGLPALTQLTRSTAPLPRPQSITALAHLRAAVLYVIDISEQCGFTIKQQVGFF